MRNLVEDFLVYLRHERGQSAQTEKTYAALLFNFVSWAEKRGLKEWTEVKIGDLMAFLEQERSRQLKTEREDSAKKLSADSLYLQIAALRALYNFAESEKFLPARYRLQPPSARPLEKSSQSPFPSGTERAAQRRKESCDPSRRCATCFQLNLAYASGLRPDPTVRKIRLENLHLGRWVRHRDWQSETRSASSR